MGGGMYSTRSAPADESEASLWACRGFLGLNIALASLGAWEKGLLVFALASLALAAAGFLLTQSLSRFLAALSSGALRHAGQIALLGAGFLSLEAVLIHHGLALLDARHDILPEGALWPASAFCSIVNLLALDTFGRPLPKPLKAAETSPNPAAMLARKRWKKAA